MDVQAVAVSLANSQDLERGVKYMLKTVSSKLVFMFAVAIMALVASVASASAMTLGDVGPQLIPSNVKAETQTMLRHDVGIQSFLHLNQVAAMKISVTSATEITCEVGDSQMCPFNTGTSGAQLVKTTYRDGTYVRAWRVSFTYNGRTYKVTFEERCSNLLSGKTGEKVSKPTQKISVSTTKPIIIEIVVMSTSKSSSSCQGVTAIAKSKASAKTYEISVSPNQQGWSTISHAVSVDTSTSTSTHCTVKKTTTPAAPTSTCPGAGQTNTNASGNACQSGSATSTATVTPTTTVTPTCSGSAQCNTTVTTTTNINQYTYQINANCSEVVITGPSGTTDSYYNSSGASITQGQCDSYTTTTTTPVPPTPTPQPTAPTITLNHMEEADQGQQDQAVASVTVPSGDTYQVCFSASYGSFSPSCLPTATSSSSSAFSVQDTYNAPDNAAETPSDMVTAVVTDETTGLHATDSTPVTIKEGDPSGGRPS